MIDFTPLSDDQLVELIRAACAEAVQRGAGTAAAAQAAYLSEAEKAQIARDAVQREAERQRQAEADRIAAEAAATVKADAQKQEWGRRRLLARMVVETLGAGWALTVWNKTDLRVYLDGPTTGSRRRAVTPKISYWHTGNQYEKPGALKSSDYPDAPWKPLRALCELACEYYPSGVTLRDTAAVAGDAKLPELPYPAEFETAIASIRAERAEAEAKAEAERPWIEAVSSYGGWLAGSAIASTETLLAAGAEFLRVEKRPERTQVLLSADRDGQYSIRLRWWMPNTYATDGASHQTREVALTPELLAAAGLALPAGAPTELSAALTEQADGELETLRRETVERIAAEKTEQARAEAEARATRERENADRTARRDATWPEEIVLIRRHVRSPLHGFETSDLRPALAALVVERRADGTARVRGAQVDAAATGYSNLVGVPRVGKVLADWSPAAEWPEEVQALFAGDETPLSRLADLPVIPVQDLNQRLYDYTTAEDSYYGGTGHRHG